MKTHLLTFLLLLLPLLAYTQEAAEAKCQILGIGNSFTEDMLTRVPDLLGADTCRFDITQLIYPGGSLGDQLSLIRSDKPSYYRLHYDNRLCQWHCDTVSFSQAFNARQWDVITLQQSSQHAGDYSTVEPSLKSILQYLDTHQPKAERYWHITWAYTNKSSHPGFADYNKSQRLMYHSIINVASNILQKEFRNEFAGYIPTGCVIQKLRDDSLVYTEGDFCRDTYHIDLLAGRYAAAATFYESVLAPRLGRCILDDTTMPVGDTLRTSDDYSLIRETVYDVVHNPDSLIWSELVTDRLYRTNYYDLMGRLQTQHPHQRVMMRQQLYVSGRKEGKIVIMTEQ